MAPDTIFSEDDGYEISIHVNQRHDPGELEFIVHQIKPVISMSFVEFCLQLYVYCDINWRWGRAIGRETVYYTRRPLLTVYLLMAGRKSIFSKTVCHMWPWNSQPWRFYITILYIYSDTLYLLSDIYYLLSIIFYLNLLSIVYYPSSIVYIYYLDFIATNCWSSALVDVTQHLYFYGCWKHEKKVKTFTIFGEMWAGSLSFIVVDFYLFTRIWISDMQITQRRT